MNSVLLVTVILVIIISIIIGLYFILREKNAKTSSIKSILTANDFGTYKKAYTSACVTTNGKCNNPGVQWVTEYCEPNSVSKKGCLDEKGNQTFASRSYSYPCQSNCRSFILNETTSSNTLNVCNYDYPYNLTSYNCVTQNAQTAKYRTFRCDKNDTIGDNACTYSCSSSGVDSAGILGDADSSRISYIPECANKPATTITLNSLPWNTIFTLPKIGVVMSKGYTINNIYLSNGTVDVTRFSISPAYPPWSDSASNIISYNDLLTLDTELTIYENCTLPVNERKPTCDNYYIYTPEELGSDKTKNPNPSLCKLNTSFYEMKDCYYHPWYSLPGEGDNNVGLKFINPYVKNNDTQNYMWIGVGNYGYISETVNCMKKPKTLTSLTNEYTIPPTPESGAVCLNLFAPPTQCANNYTDIFAVPPNVNTASISQIENSILALEGAKGATGPSILNKYPQDYNTTNYMCTTRYPDGTVPLDENKNPIPGCVQTCNYLPQSKDINFTMPDPYGNYLNSVFYDLIGKYVTINYTDSDNKEYFLTVNNLLCQNTSNLLTNCFKDAVYTPTPCVLVYNGGTGIAAGNYWAKNGCDDQSIEFTTNMRLIFSPRYAFKDETNVYSFACDIYANVGGIRGYLTYSNANPSTGTNITSLFTGNNIVANYNLLDPGNLIFNPLKVGEEIPITSNGKSYRQPYFIVKYLVNSQTFSICAFESNSSISLNLYDGNTYQNQAATFNFINNKQNEICYYKTQDFTSEYIKTEGLYDGLDVTRTINLQRKQPCYTKKLCEVDSNEICYNETCNLFNQYSIENCG
jgi:hypothetical protein